MFHLLDHVLIEHDFHSITWVWRDSCALLGLIPQKLFPVAEVKHTSRIICWFVFSWGRFSRETKIRLSHQLFFEWQRWTNCIPKEYIPWQGIELRSCPEKTTSLPWSSTRFSWGWGFPDCVPWTEVSWSSWRWDIDTFSVSLDGSTLVFSVSWHRCAERKVIKLLSVTSKALVEYRNFCRFMKQKS